MEENAKICAECGEVLTEENMYEFEGEVFCAECFDKCTVVCDECGKRIWKDNAEGDANYT